MPDAPTDRLETVRGPLDAAQAAAVRTLAADAAQADGVAPLSEQRLLWLAAPEAPVAHLLLWRGGRAAGRLAGIAQLDLGVADGSVAELVVAPVDRRHGRGTLLLDVARRLEPSRDFSIWSHGALPGAKALAEHAGLRVVRELWLMRLDLAARPTTTAVLPPWARVRTFEVGRDEDAWLAVNARAFAGHPEQGRIAMADLHARQREPWFRAEDFLLLERDGDLLAFAWLKVEADVGEIYVLGVDPTAQGLGFGTALTALALDRFDQLGLTTAILYTSADNTAAVRTYGKAGFAPANVDVVYGT